MLLIPLHTSLVSFCCSLASILQELRLNRSPFFVILQTEHPLANRTILYQMVALYDYAAQGPEDLEFSEGDTIDILGEGEVLQVNLLLNGLSFVFVGHCSDVSLAASSRFSPTLSRS